ncbi:hypothetical protein [Hymenobacter sp. AT01-02]|uniref:hypothetical protein n=1 Tax=Hymenobacter sp. AT01-02 TaxID=1571877 RepID=UPI0005F17CBA|nr:hypothetical protein [Hymenobacter sp. AT01-02]
MWAQVRQAADSFPNRPLVVVAPLLMRNFRGTRPALPANVTWHPVPPSTDSATWLLAAYQPHPDSIVLVLAHGSETAVRVRPLRLRRPLAETTLPILPAPTQVTYQPKAGQPRIRVTTGSTTYIVPVQATTPRWWVSYDAAHAPDARVLGAALQAAGSVAPIRPRLTVSTQLPPLTDSLTWLFWLRDAPVPAAWRQRVQQGMRLWQDAPAPGASVSTTLPFSSIQPPVRLLRHDTLPLHTSAWALWTDAHGSPALSVQAVGRGLLYHLHTRLAPTWSELADSPELPSQLLPLVLAPPATSTNSLDPRQLDPTQLSGNQLTPSSVVAVSSAQSGPVHDSTPLVVLAAGLLFAVERWLATRRLAQSSASSVPAA